MNEFVNVAIRLVGSVFRPQSYESVADLIDIFSGLAGLFLLTIILLAHEVAERAHERNPDWQTDPLHSHAVWWRHHKR
ncbi:hypothetical protein [Paraburkholderia haematera]|uniref:Uncharacterized protein n=1 Tax=Paraburkholderia haematera TaxID=2793077 RepID=A0ABM8R563_9BURK|nr:hypothetical protein [Paraburkholderia haematera]CAE6733272.1 hypothetical protein R69888_02166 [Paraburkholderia haematera]